VACAVVGADDVPGVSASGGQSPGGTIGSHVSSGTVFSHEFARHLGMAIGMAIELALSAWETCHVPRLIFRLSCV